MSGAELWLVTKVAIEFHAVQRFIRWATAEDWDWSLKEGYAISHELYDWFVRFSRWSLGILAFLHFLLLAC
jgi:hypothetical protein